MSRNITFFVAVSAVLVALAIAGCGDNNTTTVISTKTVTTGASTGNATSTSTEKTPSEAPTKFVRREMFQSPTGNIGCAMIGGVARCDIDKRSWSPPPRPASCTTETDYGQGLEVGKSGKAEVVCAGDTARDPGAPKLAYGTASQVGNFVCVSRSSGITCTNRKNGHGFLINQERYRLF